MTGERHLPAAPSAGYMRATLTHELGHRLALALPRTAEMGDHRLLYLFLYDVWIRLYGQPFADRMVAIERRIPGAYDYDAAWTWALAMTRDERKTRLMALRMMGERRGPQGAAERERFGSSIKFMSLKGEKTSFPARSDFHPEKEPARRA